MKQKAIETLRREYEKHRQTQAAFVELSRHWGTGYLELAAKAKEQADAIGDALSIREVEFCDGAGI